KRHVTVALSGDGADDTFASYGHHRLVGPIAACRAAVEAGRPLDGVDFGFFADRPNWVASLARQDVCDWRLVYAAFPDQDKAALWSPAGRAWLGPYSTPGFLRAIYRGTDPAADELNRMLALDLQTLLPGEILYFN